MDSGASLHMMSKNELTSAQKGTIIRSSEPVTTVSGKAESTEEAKADGNDLNVFVTKMLLVYCAKKWRVLLRMEKKGDSPSLIKDGHVLRWKSENHVCIVAVSGDLRKFDVPLKASGDRLGIPPAEFSGDWS